MKKIALFSFVFILTNFAWADQRDSLWDVWTNESKSDSARVEAMQYYAWSYLFTDLDSAIYFANKELRFAQEHSLPSWVAKAYNTKGLAFMYLGDYDSSLVYLERALVYRQFLGNKNDIARSYGNIGIVYQQLSNYTKAIDYFTKSLAIKEEVNDLLGIANTTNNIGALYHKIEDYDNEILYQERSLSIYKEINNQQGVARVSTNLGALYLSLKQFDLSEKYLLAGLKSSQLQQDLHGQANTLVSLSSLFLEKYNENADPDFLKRSENYGKQAIDLYDKLKEPKGQLTALNQMVSINYATENYSKALEIAQYALNIGKKHQYIYELHLTYRKLYQIYKELNQHERALDYYQKFDHIRDSLLGVENQKSILSNEIKYSFEKKAASDSIANAKNIELAATEIEAQEKIIDREKSIKYISLFGILCLVILGIILLRRYKTIKKQKEVIQLQKQEVSRQHIEIISSMKYAKRLQNAILPSMDSISSAFPESFVFYQPKEIVSGDFYWFEKIDDYLFIAAADCTGHGIPGAMVSMVCYNALNTSIKENGLREPGEILDETRKLVIENFEKSTENVKDGMDISLCSIQMKKNQKTVKWAGANNPIWIIRKEEKVLTETKANKQPVGKNENPLPFTTHELNLKTGDIFYLMTDGFQDQFGGPNSSKGGKKYKAKLLKNFLLKNVELDFNEQHSALSKEFMTWKSNYEQTDDVCIIGVKLTQDPAN